MNDFLEFHNKKEDINNVLQEEVATIAGAVIGLTVVLHLAAYGLSLLFYANTVTIKGIATIIRKAMNNIRKSRDILTGKTKIDVRMISKDPVAKQERRKLDKVNDKYADDLKELYEDIEAKNFDSARSAYMALDPAVKNNLDVQRLIITKITKELREPPVYTRSPGNKTYQAIKKVINIKVAQASAEAVKRALEKLSQNVD